LNHIDRIIILGQIASPHDPKDTRVAFIYDRYGHLLPEVDKQAATRLEFRRPTR
jgi:hypothetical protein